MLATTSPGLTRQPAGSGIAKFGHPVARLSSSRELFNKKLATIRHLDYFDWNRLSMRNDEVVASLPFLLLAKTKQKADNDGDCKTIVYFVWIMLSTPLHCSCCWCRRCYWCCCCCRCWCYRCCCLAVDDDVVAAFVVVVFEVVIVVIVAGVVVVVAIVFVDISIVVDVDNASVFKRHCFCSNEATNVS